MQLTVSGHHIDVTDALRNHVSEKFDKLQRHIDHINNIDVKLVIDGHVHKAEANLHISGADLFAAVESEDMYAAIDALADKLDRQIIKHKEKHRGH
ncbi:ribosomal subunit interface protein [Luminiphilus syltensis NOR5-1B]|uniref:Ribosome hibernation promoting factor n=1 Tax=Luminiphilus syltensis NOR5-1B TaxID=565045 RepID=B8KR87_9GAMM|nr:ribosome-associated translation inhibitor RaiA [Luminiphilus syltensis]EED34243.1 ribosomal subunit interface protein [Luminiphilus syltensis NOR5-1B]